jgi:hypothetical protein
MLHYSFHFKLYGQGFTENLYRANAFGSGEAVLLDNYIAKRMQLGCYDLRLLSVRASDVDKKRDVIVYKDATTTVNGTWTDPAQATTDNPTGLTNAEDSFTALLLRLSDGGSNFRTFKMLGLPDYAYQNNVIIPSERPFLTSRLNDFMAAMNGAGLGMKAQGLASATGRIVKFFPKTVENPLVCLGITGPLPAPGSLVILSSVKGFPKLNKTWRVSDSDVEDAPDPAYIYLAGSAELNTFGPVQGGTWKAPTYEVKVLNKWSITRVTSRKTGVPFDTVRGRR